MSVPYDAEDAVEVDEELARAYQERIEAMTQTSPTTEGSSQLSVFVVIFHDQDEGETNIATVFASMEGAEKAILESEAAINANDPETTYLVEITRSKPDAETNWVEISYATEGFDPYQIFEIREMLAQS